MRCNLSAVVLALVILLSGWPVSANTLDLSVVSEGTIGHSLQLLHDNETALTPAAALQAFARGQFQASAHSVLSFGIGASPLWIAFKTINLEHQPLQRRLLIETPWIDELEAYFVENGRIVAQFSAGDTFRFSDRTVTSRFFGFDHAFTPGETTVLIRTAMIDPMVLPIYLLNPEQAHDRELFDGYSYGLLYGAIGSLLAYNLMLFIGLRDNRYLLYSVYLGAFMAANLSYTGHAYQWLWPESPLWQQQANPVLMAGYVVSGLLFANRFLDLRRSFPLLHRSLWVGVVALGGATSLALISGSHALSLQLSFAAMVIFPFAMVLLGALSLARGNRSAKFFFLGSITATVGAAITATAVWGLAPFSILSYRAVDIGMLLDAVLLAMALADRLKIVQQEKTQALTLSREDPLTRLYNRRAFYEMAEPVWNTMQRNRHPLCVVMLDVDRFKKINDSYGHAFGDRVLIQIAHAMKQELRSYDILARWGGEEFIMLLPETHLEQAIIVAERIRSNVMNISLSQGQQQTFSASLGLSCWTEGVLTLETLIQHADQQLYVAKKQGRNRISHIHAPLHTPPAEAPLSQTP